MDILELRSKIVKVNKLLIEINESLLKEFQKQQGYTGVGWGYAGNGLEFMDKRIVREDPSCCGNDAESRDYR